ncbi:MAG: acetylxylan esterase, partial [Victivallales bacterium]
MYRNAENAATYRIRDIFLRVVRCLDYLKTRPEWDGETIIVRGGSLGGAQALAAAYFEPLTVLCVANAPALSDHYGTECRQAAGWPGIFRYLSDRDAQKLAAAKKTMCYFDSVNFARRLKCPVTMSVGFIDPVCPPTTVYAVYNSLPVKEKSIKNVVLGLHGVSLKKGEKSVFSHGGSLVQQACRKARQGK